MAEAVEALRQEGPHPIYAPKLRAELMERLARAMLAGSETSPYPIALA